MNTIWMSVDKELFKLFRQYFKIIKYCRKENPFLIIKIQAKFFSQGIILPFLQRSLSVGQNIFFDAEKDIICAIQVFPWQPLAWQVNERQIVYFKLYLTSECWSRRILWRENAHFPKQTRHPHKLVWGQLSTEIVPWKLMLFKATIEVRKWLFFRNHSRDFTEACCKSRYP